jgi:Raf kinase inhibitor-like YbhB/YbcL family protein
MTLVLTSDAFADGAVIPSRYSCQGDDISPPLRWEGVPATAQSLVLIVTDPDAPDPRAPRMTWSHWLLYNLPPAGTLLAEHTTTAQLPAGAKEGVNDWNRTGYGGPCPPIGRHRYFFRLYALDCLLPPMAAPHREELEGAMRGHIIAQSKLMGLYQKQ